MSHIASNVQIYKRIDFVIFLNFEIPCPMWLIGEFLDENPEGSFVVH